MRVYPVVMEPGPVWFQLSQRTQLALLTTLSDERQIAHTRSVLLVHDHEQPGSALNLIEGLQFTLLLTVPATLPIEVLLDAMHSAYYKDVLKRVDTATRSATTHSSGENTHPLYLVASINQANYELARSDEPTDTSVKRRMRSLFFVKRHQAFTPSKQSVIYNKLQGRAKSGVARTAGPVQKQW